VTRQLIVNADDLGQSPGINEGIARAVDQGIVTSTSLMVRWPSAPAAIRWAATRPEVSVGLHVDFGEWVVHGDEWSQAYRVIANDEPSTVEAELRRQVDAFVAMVGRPPTHLDSHQHVHLREPYRSAMLALAERLSVPLRGMSEHITHCGSFYGQYGNGHPWPEGITLSALLAILDELHETTTELTCHPGFLVDTDYRSMYAVERQTELAVLCHDGLPLALAERDIALVSFDGARR
jgi:predicted glycoside hydrolase/deacetylase ChbG (UPF0249 family)